MLGFACLALAPSCVVAAGEPPKLTAHDQKALHDTAKFHEIKTTADLPKGIIDLFAGPGQKMADPGQPFQATDVVAGDPLPWKRLIWAVSDGHYYVVHYEGGGIAHFFETVVATAGKGEKAALLEKNMGKRPADFAAFLKGLDHQ